METARLRNVKEAVKGGGICIYCGWDGGKDGLRSEHIVPFSLGGNVELLGASCSRCERITSYLDGYLANAVFGHFRVHSNLPSRTGHKSTLTAKIEFPSGNQRVIDFATKDHPYFLNMPIWRLPGLMLGAQMSEGFKNTNIHQYWYMPENIRETVGMADNEIARVVDTAPEPNFATFARALAKIAYCDTVRRYGLSGFRPLITPDIILGKYTQIAHFVGSEQSEYPKPPEAPGHQHVAVGGTITYKRLKMLNVLIRLFADSGTQEHGMPFYTVIVGAEGSGKITARQPLPLLPRTIAL
ncbi:MAG TPA: HNH endonuclease [Xanthobacteraceae bacterium]|jgi:hypothetical protein|nr:HNH endonuclease [Xanthobacteraceae bacterium]